LYPGVESVRIVDAAARDTWGVGMNKHMWHKDSFGFWLAVCIYLSASAGWLMVHFQIIR
jgi:hypothetical protein